MSENEGPRILWAQLKGKKVRSNDGKELGEIKEVSQNYVRVERGTLNKESFWIPKFLADVYDGKALWLFIAGRDATEAYLYATRPQDETYEQEFARFQSAPYGQRAVYLPDLDQKVKLDETARHLLGPRYKNIRDPT